MIEGWEVGGVKKELFYTSHFMDAYATRTSAIGRSSLPYTA